MLVRSFLQMPEMTIQTFSSCMRLPWWMFKQPGTQRHKIDGPTESVSKKQNMVEMFFFLNLIKKLSFPVFYIRYMLG